MEAQGFGNLETLDELLGPDPLALTETCTSHTGAVHPVFSQAVTPVAAGATQDHTPLWSWCSFSNTCGGPEYP